MYCHALFEKSACSTKARISVIKVIKELLELSKEIEKDGLIALEERVEGVSDNFCKELLRMVADLVDPAFISSFGLTYIESAHKSGATLLKDMVVLEAVLSIARRESPGLMWQRLRAYLGDSMYQLRF
jgi:flagellar motor component MotA